MVGIILLLAVAQATWVEEIMRFSIGVLDGLDGSHSGTCSKDLGALSDDLIAFSSALDHLFQGIKLYEGTCTFDGLGEHITDLMRTTGYSQLAANYFTNMGEISAALGTLGDCSADYSKCGNSLGEVVRLLIGWSLQPKAEETCSASPLGECGA